MWTIIGIAVAAYLFNKWVTRNYDYFEKKGVAFKKPGIIAGLINMTLKGNSLPVMVESWYNEFKDEK